MDEHQLHQCKLRGGEGKGRGGEGEGRGGEGRGGGGKEGRGGRRHNAWQPTRPWPLLTQVLTSRAEDFCTSHISIKTAAAASGEERGVQGTTTSHYKRSGPSHCPTHTRCCSHQSSSRMFHWHRCCHLRCSLSEKRGRGQKGEGINDRCAHGSKWARTNYHGLQFHTFTPSHTQSPLSLSLSLPPSLSLSLTQTHPTRNRQRDLLLGVDGHCGQHPPSGT